MCSACEGKPIEPHVAVDPEAIHRARDIEAAMPGERVPDAAWEIYFGFAGGSVAWPHLQRVLQAFEEAEHGRIKLRRGLRRVTAPAAPRAGEEAERSDAQL
jgi:hypothetical protein